MEPNLELLAGQEKSDICLAIKLQQEKMESESLSESYSTGNYTANGVEKSDEERQIEADADAVLLVLKNRE